MNENGDDNTNQSNKLNSDEPLYDEFGNYIGPDLESDSDSDSGGSSSSDDDDEGGGGGDDVGSFGLEGEDEEEALVEADREFASQETGAPSLSIVLHEDKVHYPSAAEVYGPDVVTAVLDEDAMDIETPIVAPASAKKMNFLEKDEDESVVEVRNRHSHHHSHKKGVFPKEDESNSLVVSDEYLVNVLLRNDKSHRGVALIGDLHTGKTSLCDLLLEQGNSNIDASLSGKRTTDTTTAEQERGLSIKSCPLTLALPDLRGKTHALTLMDCPGHLHFHEESVAALKSMDGAVLVVDALDGMTIHTEMLLRQCIQTEGLPLTLLINKIDRLWMETLMPPDDAYYKLRHTLDNLNQFIYNHSSPNHKSLYTKQYFHPAKGNVAFACPIHGHCFTLNSFAQTYLDHLQQPDDEHQTFCLHIIDCI